MIRLIAILYESMIFQDRLNSWCSKRVIKLHMYYKQPYDVDCDEKQMIECVNKEYECT